MPARSDSSTVAAVTAAGIAHVAGTGHVGDVGDVEKETVGRLSLQVERPVTVDGDRASTRT